MLSPVASNSSNSSSSAGVGTPVPWLFGLRFDLLLVVGTAMLGIGCALFTNAFPRWIGLLLFLDLWLLGYHHVVATFTRLAFDKQNLRESKFLTFGLPWIVLGGTIFLASTKGAAAIATIYLYWQWFHYTRQSYGVMRFYERKSNTPVWLQRIDWWALYTLPLFGILWRSYEGHASFLAMPVWTLPLGYIGDVRFSLFGCTFGPLGSEFNIIGPTIVWTVGAAAVITIFAWVIGQLKACREGRFSAPLALFMLSHFAVFYVGYYGLKRIDQGWLAINIWHNAQYILVVWMYNNRRFKDGVNEEQKFLSTISQFRPLNVLAYFGVCIGISTLVYGLLIFALKRPPLNAVTAAGLITFQAINFHHYIVDGIIWKRKRATAPVVTST